MKFLRRILTISILTVVGLSIGYFVFSITRLNNNVDKDYFEKEFYITRDDENFLSFGSFTDAVFYVNNEYYFVENLEYKDNVFILLVLDVEYYFLVIDEMTLYSNNFNLYFYNNNMFEDNYE